MYAVSKGPTTTRIINSRTRRDLSLKLDNLEINRDLRRKNSGGSEDSSTSSSTMSNSPKPTFNTNVSSKSSRNKHNHSSHHDRSPPPALISPAHRELANFLSSTWAVVQKELDSLEKQKVSGQDERGTFNIRRYEEKEIHPIMKSFKPFEMEAFWAQQLYTKLTADLAADT